MIPRPAEKVSDTPPAAACGRGVRHFFVVAPEDAARRLDRYLAQRVPSTCSRAVVQRAIKDGQVTVDGAVAKAHRKLKAGERIIAQLQEVSDTPPAAVCGWGVRHFLAEPIPLTIVHEDEDVLVVNKPPDLVTHPAPGHPSGTLVNAVAWHLRNSEFGMGNVELKKPIPHSEIRIPHLLPRAGIVHRLDKDTSGLLVVAKTAPALRELGRQLRERTMSRRYLALVEGHVPQDEGTIDVGVGRHMTHRKEMAVRYLGGRQAVTHYQVRGRRVAPDGKLKYTILELKLETGRTHQIRVHVAHLGHPVLGDLTYSRHEAAFWQAQGIARQFLHAYAIRFLHPSTNQPVELEIGLPEDMLAWMARSRA